MVNKKRNITKELRAKGLEPGRIDIPKTVWDRLDEDGKAFGISKKALAEAMLRYLHAHQLEWLDMVGKAKQFHIDNRHRPVH